MYQVGQGLKRGLFDGCDRVDLGERRRLPQKRKIKMKIRIRKMSKIKIKIRSMSIQKSS